MLSRRTLTPRLVRMIVAAGEMAEENQRRIGEAELLTAFLEDGGSSLDLVRALGLDPQIRERLGDPKVRERESRATIAGQFDEPDLSVSDSPTLDLIGRDLTTEAQEGRLPKIVGRDDELQRVINVLLRSEQRESAAHRPGGRR